MFCIKCGTELVEIATIKEQTFYTCPNCNYRPIYNELKAQWEPEKKKVGCLTVLGIGVAFVVETIFFCLFGFGTIIGGDTGLIVQTVGFTALAVSILIFALVKKNKTLTKIILLLIVVYFLLLLGACNNFPEFIRNIRGEDFVALWWKYDIAVYVLALITGTIVCLSITKANKNKLVKMNYSDSDLMLLQDFSSYKMAGYYLLKAKLDGIINYKITEATEESDRMILVELNKELPNEELNCYCEQNPQVKKLVEFINNRSEEQCEYGYTRVADIVNEITPEPEIQSVGGQAVTALISKLKKVRNTIIWISVSLVYYVGITKLFMGMHNDKDIEYLSLDGFCISFFILAIFLGLLFWTFKKIVLPFVISMIIKNKQIVLPNYDEYAQLFLIDNQQATVEEQQNILRYYVTHAHNPKDYNVASNLNITYNTLFSVFTAEKVAAVRAKQHSSGSGGSGCGGCGGGGCGGGCGGCGG